MLDPKLAVLIQNDLKERLPRRLDEMLLEGQTKMSWDGRSTVVVPRLKKKKALD